ncbi:toll/interleukin-1 receptor domain-containing protein [Parafrankia discariae]|uniref:toll/interleukin-1 receptor domain-containing protein n=1 Tax=Parafrankia discariae TaxID=365528 RepID=UPI002282674D|nr:toll/interleukin-1 receptor domain-containing protein [Parafrankia discariae]
MGVGVDVFVSYARADEAWATWVAEVLEAEGRTVAVQAWDSLAGTNFVSWINTQMAAAKQTVAICSPTYFASHWCTQEWTGALADNTLLPLRVEACAIPPVLATIAYRDLHGLDETVARGRLLEAAGLARPTRRSGGFPGRTPVGAVFPGQTPADARPGHAKGSAAHSSPVPAGAVRVSDADPYRLGVHRAIHLPGIDDDIPPAYVDRDIDHSQNGIRARLRTAAHRGGFVLLVGGSSVGKTRCALEAIRAELPDWWLLRPTSPTQITALAAASPARIVLWLDELQNYLGGEHGLTAATVNALLDAPTPVVLVGTIWPSRYRAFTTPPPPDTDDDPYRWERDTLRQAAVIDIDGRFTPTEQARARTIAAHDPRIQIGLDSPDDGLTQTLAAGPELLRSWTSAKTDAPYAWAAITAALDAARLGARAPLTSDLLRAAAPDYCTPRQQATAPPHWFEHALAYATTPIHGASATLNLVGTAMGQTTGYTTADYLLQHATAARRHQRPPASLWTALRDHITDPDDLIQVSNAALNRRIYAIAIPLLRRRADTSDVDAAGRLASLLAEVGEHDELRARADTGDEHAADELATLLAAAGERDGLHARAQAGSGPAARRLADLLAAAGERQAAIDLLRPHADAGNEQAAGRLAELLIKAGERQAAIDLLRPHADTGDVDAAIRLVDLLAEAGERDELHARAQAGNAHAAHRLVGLLTKAGDRRAAIDVIRPRADAGDEHAADELAILLAEVGEHDELRARADAGDEYAADELAILLAAAGERDELHARAQAGNWQASYRLADLLATAGEHDELRARADAGDGEAAGRLAELLIMAGERQAAIDIFRPHAETGGLLLVYGLINLLTAVGEQQAVTDILRTRADAGEGRAARQLADLLAEAGDERLRRYGFDAHGQIADGPTW